MLLAGLVQPVDAYSYASLEKGLQHQQEACNSASASVRETCSSCRTLCDGAGLFVLGLQHSDDEVHTDNAAVVTNR